MRNFYWVRNIPNFYFIFSDLKQKTLLQESRNIISNLISWITNPDNVGTIQVVLAINTVVMSITYWFFQWVYGEDLMSFTMNSFERNKNAFKPSTETTPTEFAIVEVSTKIFKVLTSSDSIFY